MTNTTAEKRLRKSRTDRMLDGVCGGIAAYFGIDTTLVRVAFLLLVFVGGAGVLLYLAGMILMPVEPYVFVGGATPATPVRRDSTKFWGYLLIGLGIFWMLANIGVSFWHGWWNLDWQVILAGLLIAAGLGLILGRRSVPVTPPATGAEGEQAAPPPIPPAARKLYRSRMDRKLFGVCGGLGTYFGVDSTLVRLIVVLTVLASHGLGLLAYILLAILVPDEVVVPRVAG